MEPQTNPEAKPEMTPAQARMAKARAARAAKSQEASPTERVTAPDTEPVISNQAPEVVERIVEKIVYVTQPPTPLQPRQKRVERQGDIGAPSSVRHPQVRGGICEYCGVLDNNQPSQSQYKMCPHYRGMQLRCSYCPPQKDADDVIGHTTLNIADDPYNSDVLIVWCDSTECSGKHIKRFTVNSQ